MDWQQTLDTFAHMPPELQQAWWRAAAGLLVLVVVLFWLESRFFKRSGRVGSWLAVRLVSGLAAVATVVVVVVPARAIGGPAALGVFILALYTAGPMVWFGSHVLAGGWVRPALSRLESLLLGLSGLAILAIPGVAFFAAEGPLFAAAREIAQRREVPTDNPPLEHTVQAVQRFNLAGVGLVYTQSLIGAPDTRLLHVEQRGGTQWPTERNVSHPNFCTHGNDVHLLWAASEPPPYLRLHWAQSNGAVVRSEFTPNMALDAALPPAEFTVGVRPDGVDPIAPIPRERMYLIHTKEGQTPYTELLASPPAAGEVRTTDCVMQGFTSWASRNGWQLQAVQFVFFLPTGGPALRGSIARP